ncbi:MAG: hypothetical protein QJR08_06275 [Bacillota bacterium]|nr:hypothetical protein [Bacillota bacterium]
MEPIFEPRGRLRLAPGRRGRALAGAILLALASLLVPLLTQARARPAATPRLRPAGSLRLGGAVDGALVPDGASLWAVAAGPAGLQAARWSASSGWRWAPRLPWPATLPAGGVEAVTAAVDRAGGLHVLLTTAPATVPAQGADPATGTTWYALLAGDRWQGPERVGQGSLLGLELRDAAGGAVPVVTLAAGFDAGGRPVERRLVREKDGWQAESGPAEPPPPPPRGWSYVWEAVQAGDGPDWIELVSREGEGFLEVVRVAPDGRLLDDLGRIQPPVATDMPVFHLLAAGPRWWVVYSNTVGQPLSAGQPALRLSEELQLFAQPARPGSGQIWPRAATFGTEGTPVPGMAPVPGGTRALAGTADGRLFLLWRLAPAGSAGPADLWLTELDPACG